MMRNTLNFLDSFARRMLVLVVVVSLVFGFSFPLTYYYLSLKEREQNNTLRAQLIADKLAEAIRDNQELWFYDVPRFIEISHRLPREDQIVEIKIFDTEHRLIYQDFRQDQNLAGIVSEVPVYFNSQLYGYIRIVESNADLKRNFAVVLLVLGLLCALIAFVFYWYPVKMVRDAQTLVVQTLEELAEAYRKLGDVAVRDGKTQLYNATHLMELLRQQVISACDRNEPLCLAMLDLDHFKKYNDCFGHLSGDVVLTTISDLLRKNVRSSDVLGRFGGEEFIVIFPASDRYTAERIVARLHSVISSYTFEGQEVLPGKNLTVSIGLAIHQTDMTASALVHAADMAMYTAKESGRNQICIVEKGQYFIDGKRIPSLIDFAFQKPSFQQMMQLLEHADKEHILAEEVALLTSYLKILDSRETDTASHSVLVNRIAMAIGRKFELPPNELLQLNWGTLLHDIGKLGISDAILLKQTSLTDAECEVVKRHPSAGYDLLKNNSYLTLASLVVKCHHEKWDGSGYPNRLQGKQIPLLARICCVADTVAAMAEARPYRKAASLERILTELQAHAGSQFDPGVVSVFMTLPDQQSLVFD